MNHKEFIGTTLAVAIGTLVALALAGLYLKSQLSAATSGNSTVGTLLSLFAKPAATAATPGS